MELRRFQIKNKKKNIIIGGSLLLLFLLTILVVVRSYAIYEEKQEYNVIEGSVPNFLEDFDVKLAVTIDGTVATKFPSKDSGKAVSNIICDKGATASWDYKNWMINVKNVTETRTKCQVNFVSKYSENILNGTDPVLADGMIPVVIDGNGVVRRASLGNKWYKYEDRLWANAVILNDEYVVYSENEEIPESNIESYFVWIPRYRYKIFNDGNYSDKTGILIDNKLASKVQEIEVVFENRNTNVSKGSTVGTWLTHPAFTSFDVNGFWVGKFETGYKGSTNKVSAESNTIEPEKVQIKPNVNSWRSLQVANAFFSSYDYRKDYNSHMMKNTEWGSVAYLQHSKYGSMASVRINNNSDNLTGYAAVNEPTCGYTGDNRDCNKYGIEASVTQPWNTDIGYLASTTGNISGVYDMSGGAWEYVMGVMLDQDGNLVSGRNFLHNSGFNGKFSCPTCDGQTGVSLTTGTNFPTDSRYYDQYACVQNDETYNRRILGDATGEIGPFADAKYNNLIRQIGSWYADEAWFISLNYPWFNRGSSYLHGSGTGIFMFDPHHGGASGYANTSGSFRIVLSI